MQRGRNSVVFTTLASGQEVTDDTFSYIEERSCRRVSQKWTAKWLNGCVVAATLAEIKCTIPPLLAVGITKGSGLLIYR